MKTGIIVTTYNRPQYLKECFDSLQRADLSKIKSILIVDDKSTNPESIRLINEFDLEGVEIVKVFSKENKSIKGSLLYGFDLMFNSCDLVMNLDGDAIVRNDFVDVLLALKDEFPDCIVSGFNTTVKNRNPILMEAKHVILKKYASGINMLITKKQYYQWVRPSLQKEGNWDYNTSLLSERDNQPVVYAKPSVVQHIGIEESSMGHISKDNPPDVAEDFKPLHLEDVTLFGIAYNDPEGLHRAAEISQQNIIFGDVVIITEKLFEGRVGYSHFCMKELNKYITKTSHLLKIEPDGFIQNWKAWDPKWLDYDLIGAPWEWYTDGYQVGNGISLRSKELHDILAADPHIVPTNDGIIKEHEEDHNICRIYRPYLESKYGIKYAPTEVARKFSIEAWRSDDDTYSGQFCFHGYRVKGLPFPPLPKVKPANA